LPGGGGAGMGAGDAGGEAGGPREPDRLWRLISFPPRGTHARRIGVRVEDRILDLAAAAGVAGENAPPESMKKLLAEGRAGMKQVRELVDQAQADQAGVEAAPLDGRENRLPPPVHKPGKVLFGRQH